MSTDVLEEHVATVFLVEEQAKQEIRNKHLEKWSVCCLAYASTLVMEVTCSSETSVDFQLTTRRCVLEARTGQ
jgi:hypothetical protein